MPAENLSKLVSLPVFAFKALQKLRIAFIKLLFTSKPALGQVNERWVAGLSYRRDLLEVGKITTHSLTHRGGVSAPPRTNHSSRNVHPVALDETMPSRLLLLPFAVLLC